MQGGSLSRRIAVLTTIGFAVILLLAVLVMAAVLRSETAERHDDILRELAPVVAAMLADFGGDPDRLSPAASGAATTPWRDERPFSNVALIGADGEVLLKTGRPGELPDPRRVGTERFWQSGTHRFYIGAPDRQGRVVVLGDSFAERDEALRESLIAFGGPLLPLTLIAFLLVRWITRLSLRPLDDLRTEIAARDRGALTPIDGSLMPVELRPIVTTLNGFMSRLLTALDAERQFAANAAHELRTPLALALARVQRIKAEGNSADDEQIAEVEAAIRRMTRLVERLLQLGRAEAGPNPADTSCNAREVLELLLRERADQAGEERFEVTLPEAPVQAAIGADDLAVIVANLLDNALRYSPAGGRIAVTLAADGTLSVANPGRVIPEEELPGLTARHTRRDRRGDGLGLGLYIADTLARKAGGRLELHSPARGRTDGVEAVFKPGHPADATERGAPK